MDVNERRRRASAEAGDWLAWLQGGEQSHAEREAFVDWLRESPVHVAEMLRVAQVHGVLEQFQQWTGLPTDGPADDGTVVVLPSMSARKAKRAPNSGRRTFIAVAATASAAVALLALTTHMVKGRGEFISTERGERRELVLDDGTIVKIDPQTRLRVKYEDDRRLVYLAQGRAVFRVAHNPERPFVVRASDTSVRAVGTAFGVDRRDADALVVTVVEGKVSISSPAIRVRSEIAAGRSGANSVESPSDEHATGAAEMPPENDRVHGEIFLTANEQVTLTGNGVTLPVHVESGRELAWAEGRLVFREQPVSRVVAEFNRYNRIQMRVADPALAARPISGVFDAADPESFLIFIEHAVPVAIRRDSASVVTIVSTPDERDSSGVSLE